MTMTLSRENITGWIGSILVHALLMLLFLFSKLPEILHKQEFIEVSWGASFEPLKPAPQALATLTGPADRTISQPAPAHKASPPVVLPERALPDPSNEFLAVPPTDKLHAAGEVSSGHRSESAPVGDREGRTGRDVGDRLRDLPGTLGVTPGESALSGTGAAGSSIDRGVSYSVDWLHGGTRRKMSGDLPQYPEGANVEAQIKLLTTVLPNGSITSVQPVQKGNSRLEDAAIKEVRLWRFEPLKSSQPQVEQTCVITFLFKLK